MVHDELAGGWVALSDTPPASPHARSISLPGTAAPSSRIEWGRESSPNAEIRVDNLALSILGGIQPDRLMKLGDLTSDGLLQRFLAVLMKPAKLGDPEYRVEVVEAEYEKLVKSISALPALETNHSQSTIPRRSKTKRWLSPLVDK